MPVAILGVGRVRDEVVAAHEFAGDEVRRADERSMVGVGDAGVEDRDRDPGAPGRAGGGDVRPGLRCADPELAREVPLRARQPPGTVGLPGSSGISGAGSCAACAM